MKRGAPAAHSEQPTQTIHRLRFFFDAEPYNGRAGPNFSGFVVDQCSRRAQSLVKLTLMTRINVDLGPRSYPVRIGHGTLAALGSILREDGIRQTEAFVVTNACVGSLYGSLVCASLEKAGFTRVAQHEIPSTEAGKNWDEFTKTCAALIESFPDAISTPLVVLLGGGVVGDLGGFAAAVFRRGTPFVQIPTTLLAAVDSSVGGKVAVNFGGVKNIMGAFSQPRAVLCDLSLLSTLPPREIRSGVAEIVKYGAVCSADLFEQLEAGAIEKLLALDASTLVDVTSQCVQLKARVVEQDEFDRKGIRNVLNFGHTIGHALELSADYALTHGEAISIGMIAAARIALELKLIRAELLARLRDLVRRGGLPETFAGPADLFDRTLRAMRMDKKFRDGQNLFVLPCGLGEWVQREGVDWEIVHAAVREALAG